MSSRSPSAVQLSLKPAWAIETLPQKQESPIGNSWPEVTLEVDKHRTPWLPPLVGLSLLQNSDLHPSHRLSNHFVCDVLTVAVCPRGSEEGWEVRVSIYSPLLTYKDRAAF